MADDVAELRAEIDAYRRQARYNKVRVTWGLTPKQWVIVMLCYAADGKPVPVKDMCAWLDYKATTSDGAFERQVNSIKVLVSRLRRKIPFRLDTVGLWHRSDYARYDFGYQLPPESMQAMREALDVG